MTVWLRRKGRTPDCGTWDIMKKKLLIAACGMLLALTGCGSEDAPESGLEKEPIPVSETAQNAVEEVATSEAETENNTDNNAVTSRQDGERFEGVIMLEGTEETVKYEHVRNDVLGFELDYDYESLARRSEADKESFISIYDDANDPWNYLEVTYRAENADSVTASISDELSKDYDISSSPFELTNAGTCTRIDASGSGNSGTPNGLQTVYIVPAGDGTLVATAHYTFESAEGFGHLFDYIMHTLVVLK